MYEGYKSETETLMLHYDLTDVFSASLRISWPCKRNQDVEMVLL